MEVQRGQAIALLMQGQRQQQVALQFDVNVSTTERLVRRLRDTGRVADRPRVTTPCQDRAICLAHLRNRHVTATETAYIIEVVLHYLWLPVFSFMTISVVYIMSSLLQMTSRGTRQEENIARRRRFITVIGLLLPILFLGPAVGIDQLGPDYLSSGYGKSVCFQNEYPANVIFSSGPVIVSLLINLVCLAQIIVQICRIRIEVRHVCMYVNRLSTMTQRFIQESFYLVCSG